jgi:hypothetical protein
VCVCGSVLHVTYFHKLNANDHVIVSQPFVAIRAMTCESVGRTLDEKEWLKTAALPQCLALQNFFVQMGAALAGKLRTQIYRILAEGELQRAKDYKSWTIRTRASGAARSNVTY